MPTAFDVPVALIVFNRPDTTARVLEVVRTVRPRRLLVVADGPRENRPGEAEQCRLTRALFEDVGWDCAVSQNFSPTNLGCGGRPSSGISWVFDQVEEAVILEDDCVAHRDFFPFCGELLARYRHQPQIRHIGGSNFQAGQRRGDFSYYFSKYAHIWGWATWRRAWRDYDFEMRDWPAWRDAGGLNAWCEVPGEAPVWNRHFDQMHDSPVKSTWDFQWNYQLWRRNGLAIIPEQNLVSNIGFGAGAAHTTEINEFANLPTAGLDWPLRHPTLLARDVAADAHTAQRMFVAPKRTFGEKMRRSLLKRARRLRALFGGKA